MKINCRKLLPSDNSRMAELIRYNLKANNLDIPGTVYFDEIIWHLTDFYDEKPESRVYFVLVDEANRSSEVSALLNFLKLKVAPNCRSYISLMRSKDTVSAIF